MSNHARIVKFICSCALAFLLAACGEKYPLPAAGAYPQTAHPGKTGAVVGGIGGGIVSAASGPAAHIPFGVAGGAILLGAIAGSQTITPTEFLQRNGVNVVRLGDMVEIVIPADKIFLPNSTEVKFSGEPIMYAVMELIKKYGEPQLSVAAHTDNIGSIPHKVNLSQLWSQSVVTYLWAYGIPLSNMHFVGLADSHPIGSRRTAQGSYYNRRVEIVFWVHHSNFA